MNNILLKLSDVSFPISIIEHYKTHLGPIFEEHIHENHLQLFYFIEGDGIIYCNKEPYNLTSNNIFLINNNELHYGESYSNTLRYFVFRIDLKLLASYNIAACNEKYLEPLKNNLLLFENKLENNHITELMDNIISKYKEKPNGYELKLMSNIFDLLSELFRKHIKFSFSSRDAEILAKKSKRFSKVFNYIDNNYNTEISLKELCKIAFMSEGYFCRMFKQTTGRTVVDYINRIRIEKSVILLNQGICNVTEAAMSVGFDDTNYFCRVFKKYMKQSPTAYIQNDRRYFL